MNQYQHILFATDLTSESDKIGEKAAILAKKSHAKLSMVHVYAFSPMVYAGSEFAVPIESEVNKMLLKEVRDELAQQGNRLEIPPSQQWVELGFAKTAISEFAKKQKVDLIVIGNHSRHGLMGLFGSTANNIFHQMECDVLAVIIDE